MRMLKTHAPAIFSVIDAFSTVHTNKICMRLHFDPLSRACSNRYVFDQNHQRIGVDRRPKRIEMYMRLRRDLGLYFLCARSD